MTLPLVVLEALAGTAHAPINGVQIYTPSVDSKYVSSWE